VCGDNQLWMSTKEMLGIITNMLQPKHMVFAHNDDPMQIDKTWFKPFIEHEKQCWRVNNPCLYCGEPRHIIGGFRKKCVQYVTHATTSTTTQGLEEKGNEDV
jgi:hypothetical protein